MGLNAQEAKEGVLLYRQACDEFAERVHSVLAASKI
jgi:hypothetical protein